MKLEKSMFERILSKMNDENSRVAESLIDEICFMQETLSKLKETVETEGTVIERKTGNNVVTMTEHPAMKLYNSTIKSYTTCCKTLLQYLPKDAMTTKEEDEFLNFCLGKTDHIRCKSEQMTNE